MKNFSLFLFFVLLWNIFDTKAQTAGRQETGAKAAGMGNTVATVQDAWAIFNNIGALAGKEEGMDFFFASDTRFIFAELNTIAAGLTLPTPWRGTGGIGAWRFGDDLYNEHRVSLGYSHKLGGVSIGTQINYVQINIQGLGTRSVWVLEFGGVAQLTKTLFLGAHIYNFNQARLAAFEDERLPTVMKAGISYRPNKRFMLNLETEKDGEYTPSVEAGLSYSLIENKIDFRTGVTSEPFVSHFGAGFFYKSFALDYAVNIHDNQVGLSHYLSVRYRITKPAKKGNSQKALPPESH